MVKYPSPKALKPIVQPGVVTQNWTEDKLGTLLPQIPHTPSQWPKGVPAPLKHPRADIDMMGPERIHNQLIYRQYGIIALGGGALKGAHYDVIRDRINKWLDKERFFAIWRIDPPWKAVSRVSAGFTLGGGKAKVKYFEHPIKAGRILVEVAGRGEYGEVKDLLEGVCKKLPIYSMAISQDIMDKIKAEKLELDARNYNPFEYRYLLRNNFSDSQRFTSPTERIWGGTYY